MLSSARVPADTCWLHPLQLSGHEPSEWGDELTAARWPARVIAERVLDALREDGKLHLPVDPIVVARDLGINVYNSRLGPAVSGMIVKLRDDEEPDIFLNDEHSPVRQRFTCAHELGHYFGNYTRNGVRRTTYSHKRDSLSSCGTDVEEKYANSFAANLLMPEDDVRDLVRRGYNTVELASRLWVSPEAAANRLNSLGLR